MLAKQKHILKYDIKGKSSKIVAQKNSFLLYVAFWDIKYPYNSSKIFSYRFHLWYFLFSRSVLATRTQGWFINTLQILLFPQHVSQTYAMATTAGCEMFYNNMKSDLFVSIPFLQTHSPITPQQNVEHANIYLRKCVMLVNFYNDLFM